MSVLGIAGWLFLAVFVVGGDGAAGTLASMLPVFIVGLVLSLPVALVGLVGAVAGLLSRAAKATGRSSERVHKVARFADRHSETARFLGLSDVVADLDTRTPEERDDDRIDELKQQHVDGELAEAELERKIRRIHDEEGVDQRDASSLDQQIRQAGRE